MSRQRLFLLIASLLGMLSCFLPWQQLPLSDTLVNGLNGYGWLVFGGLVVSAVASVAGNRKSNLGRLLRLVCILIGLSGSVLMMIYLGGFDDIESRQSTGYAPYFTTLATIAVLALAYFFPPNDPIASDQQ